MSPAVKKRLIFSGILLAGAIVAGVLAFCVYRELQDLEGRRQTIEAYARRALGRELKYGAARLSFRFGPALTFTDVKIAEKDRPETFAAVKEIVVRIAVLPYLREKKIVVKELRIQAPRILISRDREGIWNVADLFVADTKPAVELGEITVTGGEITLADGKDQAASLVFKDLDLRLERWERGVGTAFSLAGTLAGKAGPEGRLSLRGKLKPAKATEDILTSVLTGTKLRVENLALADPWPWYRQWTPFQKLAGDLNAEVLIDGSWQDFRATGFLEVTGAELVYPAVFPEDLKTAKLRLECELEKKHGELILNRAKAVLGDLELRGKALLKDLQTPDPYVEAAVGVKAFDLERHGKLIPYGLIPAATADFVRRYIRSGVFHVETGTIKGRFSELQTWGAANRPSILNVKAKVEKGTLRFGEKVPLFSGITGELVLTERDFRLQGMSGNFGAAPFTLTGKIEDYASSKPSTYPFTASIQPSVRELAWIFGDQLLGKTAWAGKTVMKITGNGPATAYEVDGEWDLAPASYHWGAWLAKPAGRANTAAFKLRIDSRGLSVAPFRFHLPPLVVTGSAYSPFADTRGTRLAAQFLPTPLLGLKDISPLLMRHEAAGKVQGDIQYDEKAGPTASRGRWRGKFSLEQVRIKPAANFNYLQDLAGVIQVKGEALATAGLSGRYGNTPFTLAGTVTGFAAPVLEGSLAVPILWPEDLKAGVRLAGVPLRDVRAKVSYRDDLLSVTNLSFRFREGRGAAAGETRFGAAGKPSRHRYRFHLDGMPVADLFRELDKERLLTGVLSARGELAASGTDGAELLKSATGNVEMRIEKGTLKKFQVLAKILSFLNVSQLLRFKLPDISTAGMPFRSMAATLRIGDGVAAGDDFFLQSDAMNIVAAGRTDLINRTIDALVGLQPLQTIDRVVSRIPIAGWILTDDDRRLITVYFEAKGPLDNPVVKSIPLKGLSEETLGIFKRVLQLPNRLITGAGTVIE